MVVQHVADPTEVRSQTANTLAIKPVFHPHPVADFSVEGQLPSTSNGRT